MTSLIKGCDFHNGSQADAAALIFNVCFAPDRHIAVAFSLNRLRISIEPNIRETSLMATCSRSPFVGQQGLGDLP
jgi:hypothetical protein